MENEMLQAQAETEIKRLHAFFVEWFNGLCAKDADLFEKHFSDYFTKDSILIPPSGMALSFETFSQGVFDNHGKSNGFAIVIRNVVLRPLSSEGTILATYEEWQRNAANSTPPDNGRTASVVFKETGLKDRPLQWFHIHETWLPKDIMAQGPYDF